MLSACNCPPVSYLIWFATCNASMSQLQWETCSTLRMGQTNNRVTWSCVCLLSENDSWQRAGSGATPLSCLLPYSQHQAGRSMARVGRFLNVNWCHAFKYKSFFFFFNLNEVKIDCVDNMLVFFVGIYFYLFMFGRHPAGPVWGSDIAASPLCLRCWLTAMNWNQTVFLATFSLLLTLSLSPLLSCRGPDLSK